jgi:hypothetical protein
MTMKHNFTCLHIYMLRISDNLVRTYIAPGTMQTSRHLQTAKVRTCRADHEILTNELKTSNFFSKPLASPPGPRPVNILLQEF